MVETAADRQEAIGRAADPLLAVDAGTDRVLRCKRVADVTLIALASPLIVPLGAVVGLTVLVFDGRPVLFRQRRLGYLEKDFELLKFRTMRNGDGRDGDRQRITRLGRWLRTTSLDELPQLWNVLRGEMTLVGPRPLYVEYAPFYSPRERRRHSVRPGITGLAQVTGRNSARWSQRLALDAAYVEAISLRADLSILVRTARSVLRSDGVSLVARDTGEPLDVERSYPHRGDLWIRRFNALDIEPFERWLRDRSRGTVLGDGGPTESGAVDGWYRRVRDDPDRDALAIYSAGTGAVLAVLGLAISEEGGAELLHLAVDPASTREDLDRTALDLMAEWARSHGCRSVRAPAPLWDAAARGVLEGAGFDLGSSDDEGASYSRDLSAP